MTEPRPIHLGKPVGPVEQTVDGLVPAPAGPAESTAAPRDRFELTVERGLRWVDSPKSDAHARRGFCGECGSSLFWDAPGRDYVAIAAGTVEGTTGVRTAAHWYVGQKGDWYSLPDDGLPRHEGSAAAAGVNPSG